jgi:hypothetical protein
MSEVSKHPLDPEGKNVAIDQQKGPNWKRLSGLPAIRAQLLMKKEPGRGLGRRTRDGGRVF